MGEPTTSPTALGEATVEAPLPQNHPGTVSDARPGFYEAFKYANRQYHSDFLDKRHQELNSALILGALLSAVTYVSIILIGDDLKRDFEETNDTIRAFAAASYWPWKVSRAGADPVLPQWNGPNITIMLIRTILGMSLASFIFTMTFVVMCKQLLNSYARAKWWRLTVDRRQDQRRRKNGMVAWRFDLVVGYLPPMLLLPLLLLSHAIFVGLSSKVLASKILAGIAVGFTAFSLFILRIARAVAPPRNRLAPQTPPSDK